ncbi:N-acetyltransferase [Propionispora hippei]|uniref:Putative acetyltransferase n=1 Tax=Propionispora hippei DSM 15287 TaxID=1123003 RepID=A0A1M6DM37_9FIRM|nr:N-acetyltransferase [Propionispora hippei]SHI74245.1 putative acetyltransferase [Propionispora hippei DSM 15287]
MIKEFEQAKMNEVMKIWLDTTINAHYFIPEKYWVDSERIVRERYLPIAKTFIYDEDSIIKGFISIMEGFFIGALFVAKEYQQQGIGLKLINYCKKLYPTLELAVYVDNMGAVEFYKRCGFTIQTEQANEGTGFKEYIMVWNGIE